MLESPSNVGTDRQIVRLAITLLKRDNGIRVSESVVHRFPKNRCS